MRPRRTIGGWAFALAALAACTGPDRGEPDWMARLDDTRGLAELSIPGTHDSGALLEPYPGLAQCQDLTIEDQLAAGVRYFDIRCRHFDDAFLIYHGGVDQEQSFDDVLATMFRFLDAHPTETLIVSVKEESVPSGATRSFADTFAAYVAEAPTRWYLGPALPRLGDVRGKLVLLRRFPATVTPLGIDGSAWQDNTTFTLDTPDARLRIQDAYMVTDNAAKWQAITDLLTEARTSDASTLMLDYTSGYQLIAGLPNVPVVADDIDGRLDTFLGDPANAGAHLGVVVMDFASASRVAAIVATNPP